MDRVGDACVWPVRDPEWPGKLLIIALTLLIPIVGAINGLGWMLATLDRLRAGEERMAPANLGYIARGAQLFVVQLAYGLAVAAVALVIYLPAVLLAVSQGHGEANSGLIVLALFLNVLAFGVATIGSLAAAFARPALVAASAPSASAARRRLLASASASATAPWRWVPAAASASSSARWRGVRRASATTTARRRLHAATATTRWGLYAGRRHAVREPAH